MHGSVSSTELPVALDGPGRIVKCQTTYWELEARSGTTFRVYFKGKEEFFFAGEDYPSVAILDEHPLLLDFHEPNLDLYVAGRPIDAGKVVNQIDARIQSMTDGWRTLERYVNVSPETLLAGGHGLFMRAPESICTAVTEVLKDAGIGATTPGRRLEGGRQRLLLLGRSYVIANDFGFQPNAAAKI